MKLSDAAARTHAEALGYLYGIEQDDCHFDRDLLAVFAASRDRDAAAVELVERGLWRIDRDDYVVEHHGDVLRASLTAQRNRAESNRKAQRKARGKKKCADEGDDVSADISDSPNNQTDKHPLGSEATSDEDEPWESLRSVPSPRDGERPFDQWRRSGEPA